MEDYGMDWLWSCGKWKQWAQGASLYAGQWLPWQCLGRSISILAGRVGGPRGQELVRSEAKGLTDWVCHFSSCPSKGEAGGSDTWDGMVTLEWGHPETLEHPISPETVELGRNPPPPSNGQLPPLPVDMTRASPMRVIHRTVWLPASSVTRLGLVNPIWNRD